VRSGPPKPNKHVADEVEVVATYSVDHVSWVRS
jgi:hypothetical protein